jgi:DNA-binding protein H-NS
LTKTPVNKSGLPDVPTAVGQPPRPEPNMKPWNLESMSIDELWTLHEQLADILTARISEEKTELEKRLRRLGREFGDRPIDIDSSKSPRERRPYPRVMPKYCNPSKPSETWSGRGKTPRWLKTQLEIGRNVEDFRISSS